MNRKMEREAEPLPLSPLPPTFCRVPSSVNPLVNKDGSNIRAGLCPSPSLVNGVEWRRISDYEAALLQNTLGQCCEGI